MTLNSKTPAEMTNINLDLGINKIIGLLRKSLSPSNVIE